jgi:hypothetical protein
LTLRGFDARVIDPENSLASRNHDCQTLATSVLSAGFSGVLSADTISGTTSTARIFSQKLMTFERTYAAQTARFQV